MNDEDAVFVAIAFIFIALLVGVFVYAWMLSAGLPTVISGPIGVFSFLVVLAALFGIEGVIIAAIKAISELLN